MEHTKEPWSIGNPTEIHHCDGTRIVVCCQTADDADRCRAEDNARRIVACVNACAGIPTEQLEIEPYIGSVSYRMRMHAENQRDELLKFLREIADVKPEAKDLFIHTVKCKAAALLAIVGEQL